jgi:hypothetical protein
LLLSIPADWRWLDGRDDNPWYPATQLFRQRQRGEWGEVIARIRSSLEHRVSEKP